MGITAYSQIPDIDKSFVPNSFTNSGDKLVIPIWRSYGIFVSDGSSVRLVDRVGIVTNLAGVKNVLTNVFHEGWTLLPNLRIGKPTKLLAGFYLIEKNGDAVWVRVTFSGDGKQEHAEFSFIKWGLMDSNWVSELLLCNSKTHEIIIVQGDDKFWGADWLGWAGRMETMKVKTSKKDEDALKEFVRQIRIEKIVNADNIGKWYEINLGNEKNRLNRALSSNESDTDISSKSVCHF